MPSTTFVAPEQWRNTTGPVVCVWSLFPYQALARYNDLRSAEAMEEYNWTRCTRAVDPFQNHPEQKNLQTLSSFSKWLFEMPSMTFVAPEQWRNTTGPIVRLWLIVPKPSRTEKPLKPIQF